MDVTRHPSQRARARARSRCKHTRVASRLASLAPLAIRGNKRALADLENRTLEEHLALEAQIQADCIRSADFKEGLDAFQIKRPPAFEGK